METTSSISLSKIEEILNSPVVKIGAVEEESGISRRTLTNIRDRKTSPKYETLEIIAAALRRLGFDLSQPPEIRSQTEDHQHPATGTD